MNTSSDTSTPEGNQFQFIIRQQPLQARQCGFGTKGYRPVDPVPILQLISKNNTINL